MWNRFRDSWRISSQDVEILGAGRRLACLTLAIVVAGAIAVGCKERAGERAKGRESWPTRYASPIFFYSTDMSPVEIHLRHFNDADSSRQALLHIPRAAIVYASRFDAEDVDRLPEKIETEHVVLALTYPDGVPLSARAKELSAEENISEFTAIRNLRSEEYSAMLYYLPPGVPWEDRVRESQKRLKIVDYFEGLAHAPADTYIGEPGRDEFLELRCYPEATRVYFCKGKMRISAHVTATVDFPDFRFHGGRDYANERLRKFRDFVCQYLTEPCGAQSE